MTEEFELQSYALDDPGRVGAPPQSDNVSALLNGLEHLLRTVTHYRAGEAQAREDGPSELSRVCRRFGRSSGGALEDPQKAWPRELVHQDIGRIFGLDA